MCPRHGFCIMGRVVVQNQLSKDWHNDAQVMLLMRPNRRVKVFLFIEENRIPTVLRLVRTAGCVLR